MPTAFEKRFRSLTGFQPMRWQCRLFERFLADDVPDGCDVPTGLGKTSVIVVWLLALVEQAESGGLRLPRRLAYVVNRRTVVDQATTMVENIRRRLMEPGVADWAEWRRTLEEIAEVLKKLCAWNGNMLGVSTLRGELADNEEWKIDPARPAVVVGTIDMVGSKLLFSGYGDGPYHRAHHAGLIGQDTLIVHDEAHLSPAFSELVRAVVGAQQREMLRSGQPDGMGHGVRVIDLSATVRSSETKVFRLRPEDEEEEVVRERLSARKRLHVHEAGKGQVIQTIVDLATKHETARAKVLIYVQKPKDAGKVAEALKRALRGSSEGRTALLTGTIRGYERDELTRRNEVYRAFMEPGSRPEQTLYLVCTSAGEVGIDLDADHLVCDATTLDAFIQRLGRVNRRGGKQRSARVDVVGERGDSDGKPSAMDPAVRNALQLLKDWGGGCDGGADVSPQGVRKLVEGEDRARIEAAFSPTPEIAPLTDILLDAFSVTSIDEMPGRPGVEEYLHGLTSEPPESYLAWRKEISVLDSAGVEEASLREWFRSCRIEARERLRDRTDHIRKGMAELLAAHRKLKPDANFPVVVLDERGTARWGRLSEVVREGYQLNYRTVVLPVEARGLSRDGTLDPTKTEEEGIRYDVAEESGSGDRRERWLHSRSLDSERYERLLTGEIFDAAPAELREKERIELQNPENGDGTGRDLLLLVAPARSALDNPETAAGRQTLARHTEIVVEKVRRVGARLELPETLQAALVTAAQWHDRGKSRPVWQRYARNTASDEPVAKAASYLHWRALGGYRHELGALLEASRERALRNSEEGDLVLHLIATHHGWARPHFDPRCHDNTFSSMENREAACEAARRFERLQRRFGRWRLAWLECLLRCADIAASREDGQPIEARRPEGGGA